MTAIALHGDMVQERRSAVLQGFLEGKHMCVVATGVLGRGLDLVNVTQVYNFDMPNSITDFIHQVSGHFITRGRLQLNQIGGFFLLFLHTSPPPPIF